MLSSGPYSLCNYSMLRWEENDAATSAILEGFHPLTVQPRRAGPKVGGKDPERLPKVINSRA